MKYVESIQPMVIIVTKALTFNLPNMSLSFSNKYYALFLKSSVTSVAILFDFFTGDLIQAPHTLGIHSPIHLYSQYLTPCFLNRVASKVTLSFLPKIEHLSTQMYPESLS